MMDINGLEDMLRRLRRAGKIDGSELVMVRNPDVSEAAMDAGSDGYHVLDDVLVPGDERIILLGEVSW